MNIGFDARMISHPGIGRYIENLLHAMTQVAEDSVITLYGDLETLSSFKGLKECQMRQYAGAIYSWSNFFSPPFKKNKFDLIHIPHFNVPFKKIDNLVVTIHDLIYLKFGENLPAYKRFGVEHLFSNAIEMAEKIIAVSENTKKDIIERYPEAEEKIRVIYEAADHIFKKIGNNAKKEEIRHKYNLPEDIILSVGSLKRHKNIERLVDVYTNLKAKGIKHRLVVVGRCQSKEEEKIRQRIESTDAIYLGEIPSDDLVVVYNLSRVFVMPSLYEGFGLPVLEAMACGVAVAASRASSLPEVAGDAALLFDPYDVKDISDKMSAILSDEPLRQDLIKRGLERAKQFSWKKTAEKTLEVYRDI